MHNLDNQHKSGIPLIDEQHQNLLKRISDLKSEGGPSNDTGGILESLVEINELAREHFSHEEKLLENAGYDQLEKHAAQHERILYDLNDLVLSFTNNEISESSHAELIQLLTDWFEKHLLQEDVHFFSDVLNNE